MRKKTIYLFLFLFPVVLFSRKKLSNSEQIVKKYIVEIKYTTIHYNKVYPWIKELGEEYKQYGILLDSFSVLTQCDELLSAVSIEVRNWQDVSGISATVNFSDMEVNLCILKLQKSILHLNSTWKDLEKGKDPKKGQNVQVYFFDSLKRIRSRTYSVNSYQISSDYGFTKLPVFTLRTSKSIQVGSPIFFRNRLVGMVSYYSRKKLVSIPISRLIHFVHLYKDKTYKGFVVQGFRVEPIEAKSLRKFYGLQGNGCFVKEVLRSTSAYSYLKEGDIILEIDSIRPNRKCLYSDPLLGAQKIELLLTRNIQGIYRKAGSTVSIRILRNRKVRKFEIPLISYYHAKKSAERIPWKVYGQQPYIVQHGLIFVELTRPYLVERLGKNWRRKALELSYLYDYKKYYKKDKEKDKIILISSVLPDPINVDYQSIRLKPVIRVDGHAIDNLKQLYEIFQKKKNLSDSIVKIELSDHKMIFLDLSKEKEHRNILKRFRIPSDHFFP